MAYRVNVYFNSEYIASTNIRSGSFINVTGYYGDDAYIADGFTNSTTFTATPADGCEFVKWYYRIGGDSGTLQESTDNPFYYSGTEEIIIRAVGQPESSGGDEEIWTDSTSSLGAISSKRTRTFTLNPYQLRCYTFYFTKSGMATVYTTGTVVDTYGFVTENTDSYDEVNGNPWESDILAEGDSYEDDFGADDGLNFSLTFWADANTTYKVWVRGYYTDQIGSVSLVIKPPSGTWAELDMGSLGTITNETSVSIDIQSYVVYRFAVAFANDGTAKFYTTGDVDTYGQYSDTTGFNTSSGYAESYIKRNNDGGEGKNFSISDTISAGTTYYVWVSGLDGDDVGQTTFFIIPPESTSTQWTWSDEAYNAFTNNGLTTDVSYTEWNEFVNFVAEKTGYSTSAALMSADDKTLYAIQFNAVRYAIGSVNTFQNGTNSLKDHYTETGQWDMSSGEVVKGQYFIDLAKYLNNVT